MKWMTMQESVESSPETHLDQSRKLLKTAKRFRALNRHKGCSKCAADATKAGCRFYLEPFCCYQNDELQLQDSKNEAGLCTNCHGHGTKARDKLVECTQLFTSETDPRRRERTKKVGKLQDCFRCGLNFTIPWSGPNQQLHQLVLPAGTVGPIWR